MVINLAKKGVFNTDIKLQNIVLCYDFEVDKLKLYLIDFRGVSFDFREVNTYTKFYFFQSKEDYELYEKDSQIFFKDVDTRIRRELKTVAKTILQIFKINKPNYLMDHEFLEYF